MIIQKHKFKNGLRLINLKRKGLETATVLVMAGCGSRYEKNDEAGISHFLEHIVFKGTKSRPNPLSIAETIDSIGGETNAFTGKEITGFYAKVDHYHFKIALDFVSDIYQNALLKENDISREKGVVIEEIHLYQDTPIKYILSLAEEIIWPKSDLGRDIVGYKKSVRALNSKKIRNYLRRFYTAQNTIVGVVSPFDIKQIQSEVLAKFAGLKRGIRVKPTKAPLIKTKTPRLRVFYKKTDQAHLALNFNTDSFNHKDYPVIEVIDSLLGSNMSSRLFSRIREQLGLAYLIKSYTDSYQDVGALTIQAGLRLNKVKEAVRETIKELTRLKIEPIKTKELDKGKEFLLGKLALEKERGEEIIADFLIREFFQKKPANFEKIEREIKKVTAKDVLRVSKKLFQDKNMSLAIIGPYRSSKEFQKVLHF